MQDTSQNGDPMEKHDAGRCRCTLRLAALLVTIFYKDPCDPIRTRRRERTIGLLGWVIDLSTYRLTTKEARSNNHDEEGRQIGLMPLSGQLQFLFYNVHTLRKQTLSTSTCASIPSSSVRGSPKTRLLAPLAFFRCGNK